VSGTLVVIVHTDRDDMVRIISMRRASKNEQIIYETEIANRLEEN